jgi:hypothetical protein
MRLMRPEKSWRPIVAVEVDNDHVYETVLGTDGQNPNLKDTFRLYVYHQLHCDNLFTVSPVTKQVLPLNSH